MGVPSGGNLGAATGSVRIDTSQAQQAVPVMRGVAAGINQAMSSVGASTNRAGSSFSALAMTARSLAGAFGIGIGVQAVTQLGRAAMASAELATAYQRQVVAARSLAGSQEQVNKLLAAYEDATGGAVDKAASLAAVTRLQAIGFGDTAKEVEQFARAVRGISLAMGQSQDYVTSQLQLAIANQSELRLDQIGFGVAEVQKRIAELRSENSGLTKEMAYQNAILGLAEEKYGALSDSAEGQASEVEKLSKSWKDFGLQFGLVIKGPVDVFAKVITAGIKDSTDRMVDFLAVIGQVEEALRRLGMLGIDMGSSIASRTSIGRVQPKSFGDNPEIEGRKEARLDWAKGVTELNERTNDEILDQAASYQSQRANAERDYQQNVTREAQDFATNRTRQEVDFLRGIEEIRADAARREMRMAADLASSIAKLEGDSTERIAEARNDTNDRLAELEEDYQRNREKAARDHRDSLLDAAGRLDAKSIAEAQRNFDRSRRDAEEAHNDQRDDLQKQLDKRTADESANLAERIAEAKDAHQKQLADARAADAERLADMQADHAFRQARENEDRAIRLARMAEDHQSQLDEMARANSERLAQIYSHSWEERTALDEAHRAEMVALGTRNKEWIAEQEKKEEALEELWDRFFGHISNGLSEPLPAWMTGASQDTPADMGASSLAPQSYSGGGSRSSRISIGDVNVHVAGTNASAGDIAGAVRFELTKLLEEVAG